MSKDRKENFFSVNIIDLAEESAGISTVEVLREGIIRDRGLKITKKMLNDFVDNFKDNVYGTELQVNLGHQREGEAAGWIKDLYLATKDGVASLQAKVEWTSLGLEKLRNKLYKFVSAEFSERFPHHMTGKTMENVFSGLALTNTPALKGQSPISLSEEINQSNINFTMFKSYIQNLSERAVVAKADKEFARAEFTKLSEEQQAEAKEAMDAVEAKPEAPADTTEADKAKADAEAKAAADKAEAEKVAAEKAKTEAEATPAEKLSEQLSSTQTELAESKRKIKELSEKMERQELSESFEKELMLSEAHTTGLNKNMKEKVVAFQMLLSESQREEFKQIVLSVRHADVATLGSEDAEKKTMDADKAVVEATKLSEKSGRPMHEHLMELYAAQELSQK